MLLDSLKKNIEKSLIDYGFNKSFITINSVNLLAMIACHESKQCQLIRQTPIGNSVPILNLALGVYQMELATAKYACEYVLANPSKFSIFFASKCKKLLQDDNNFYDLIFNFGLSTSLARAYLSSFPERIPVNDTDKAEYAKKYWNTHLGKATADKYLDDYNFCKNI